MAEPFQPAMPDFRDLTLSYPADHPLPSFTLNVPRALPLPSAILCHGFLFLQDEYIEDLYWMQYSHDVKPFRDTHGGVVFFHSKPPA